MTRKLFEWIPATEKNLPKVKDGYVTYRDEGSINTHTKATTTEMFSRLVLNNPDHHWEYLREADPVVWPGDSEIEKAYEQWRDDDWPSLVKYRTEAWKAAINWVRQQMENKK